MKSNEVKKIVTAAVGAALALGLLTGCGDASATTPAEGSEAPAETAAPAAAEAESEAPAAETEAETTEEEGTAEAYTGEVTVVRAVTKGSPAPYIYIDENDELQGFDIAVLNEVFERLPQYDLQWTVADDSLTGLLSGVYDISAGNWAYRAERAESYYFTYPYKLTDKVFVQRADDTPLVSLQDAADRGYKIEVGAGGPVTDALESWNEAHPDAQIELTYSDATWVVKYQHIIDGVFDFAIDDSPLVSSVVSEYGFTEIAANGMSDEALLEVFPKVYTYYLVRKDEEGLAIREDVDAVLKELYEDGTLLQLSETYFGKDVTPAADQFEQLLN